MTCEVPSKFHGVINYVQKSSQNSFAYPTKFPAYKRRVYEHSLDKDVTFLTVCIGSLRELIGQDLMAPNNVPAVLFQSCEKFQTLLPGDSCGPCVPDQGNPAWNALWNGPGEAVGTTQQEHNWGPYIPTSQLTQASYANRKEGYIRGKIMLIISWDLLEILDACLIITSQLMSTVCACYIFTFRFFYVTF